MGAIESGKTICGVLFGATVFLGYLHGVGARSGPAVDDAGRQAAIASVNSLFNTFIEKFGDTDCQRLTGCDWSKKADRTRYFKEEVYRETCYHYFKYVLEGCLARMDAA